MKRTPSIVASSVSQTKHHYYSALNKSILQCTSTLQLESLLFRTRDFDGVSCSTALSKLSKLGSKNHECLNMLLGHLRTLPLAPRNLSSCFHSLAISPLIPHLPPPLVQQLLSSDLSKFNDMDISTTLCALAKKPPLNSEQVLLACNSLVAATTRLHTFRPHNLSNTVWALAKLDIHLPEFLNRVAEQVQLTSSQFGSQDIVNTLFAYSKLNCAHPMVLSALSRELTRRDWKTSFSSFELMNLVKSLASLQCDDAVLIERAVESVGSLDVNTLQVSDAINLLGSLVKWNLGKKSGVDVINKLLKHLTVCTQVFTAQDISSTFHILANLKWREEELISKLVLQCEAMKLHEFTAQGLSTVLWAMAKLSLTLSPTLLDKLNQEIPLAPLHTFDEQSLSNMLWGLAMLLPREPPSSPVMLLAVIDAVKVRVGSESSPFSVSGLTHVLWALAMSNTHAGKEKELIEKLCLEILSQSQRLTPHDWVQFLWSCARLEYAIPSEEVHAVLLKCKTLTWTSQHLSKLVWALAKLNIQDPIVWSALSSQVENDKNFLPHDIAMLYWGFATQGISLSPHLLLVNSRVDAFNAQDLSQVIWALASTNKHDETTTNQKLGALLTNRDDWCAFPCQALATTLWSLGKLQVSPPPRSLLVAIADKDPSLWSSQDLSNLLFGAAKLGLRDVKLLTSLSHEMVQARRLSEFSLQAVLNIMWSLAQVNFFHPLVCNHVAKEMSTRRDVSLQEWSYLLWSFACLDALRCEEVERLFRHHRPWTMMSPTSEETANLREQLSQVRLAWKQLHPFDASALLDALPRSNHMAVATSSSLTHDRFFQQLKPYFPDLVNEHVLLDTLVVDMYIPSYNTVIEVDGPFHFLIDGKTLNGPTAWKRRMLERAGFTVCSIPVQAFDRQPLAHQTVLLQSLAQYILKTNPKF